MKEIKEEDLKNVNGGDWGKPEWRKGCEDECHAWVDFVISDWGKPDTKEFRDSEYHNCMYSDAPCITHDDFDLWEQFDLS